eukprot:366182-Chlamydomonas_euryale.AAC.13
MTRLRALHAAVAGAWPQPCIGGQLGSHQAGSKHPRGKQAAVAVFGPPRPEGRYSEPARWAGWQLSDDQAESWFEWKLVPGYEHF